MQNISIIYLIIVILFAAAAFYGLLHILRQLRLSWRRTLALAGLFGLLSAAHQILLVAGNYYDLSLIHPLLYLTSFASNFGALALPVVLVTDLILIVIRLINSKALTSARGLKYRKRLGLAYLTLFTVCAAAAEAGAVAAPTVTRQDIYITDLHPDLEGLTIAQISDVHSSVFFTRERSERMTKLVQELRPDLIVFTGDQVDGTPVMRQPALEPFKDLSAPLGIFFIPGNHEYITGMAPWVSWYQEMGYTLLMNSAVRIKRGQAVMTIAGLDDDQALRAGEVGFTGPDLDKALTGVSADDFRLLLAHQPRQARHHAQEHYGIDLMLSGHTHGGQVPGLIELTAAVNQGFVRGLYQVDDMQLYVSQGAGLWQGFCARLGTNSEIVLFTLKKAP